MSLSNPRVTSVPLLSDSVRQLDDDQILRPREAARFLGISRSSLYLLRKRGELPAPIRLGARATGFRARTLRAWIADREMAREAD